MESFMIEYTDKSGKKRISTVLNVQAIPLMGQPSIVSNSRAPQLQIVTMFLVYDDREQRFDWIGAEAAKLA